MEQKTGVFCQIDHQEFHLRAVTEYAMAVRHSNRTDASLPKLGCILSTNQPNLIE